MRIERIVVALVPGNAFDFDLAFNPSGRREKNTEAFEQIERIDPRLLKII